MAERILRWVGVILLLGGMVDVVLLAAHVILPLGHQAGWWLPGAIGGMFLVLGSLRAVVIVRQISAFCAAATATAIATAPWLQPLGLLAAKIRQLPVIIPAGIAASFAGLVSLILIVLLLDHEAVRSAVTAAGLKFRSLYLAMSTGCVAALVIFGFALAVGHSADAAHACQLAERVDGPNYHYFIRLLVSRHVNGKERKLGLVDVWNDKQLMLVPVEWTENS